MADVLRLADISQGTTVDLLSGTMQLIDNTWMTQTPGEEYDYNKVPFGAVPSFKNFSAVQETMDLLGNDTSVNVRSGVNSIEDVLEGARLYHSNELHETSYWLEWNADGESAKRSLLYTGAMQYPLSVGVNQFLPNNRLVGRLTMTRHPLWETTTATTISSSGVSCSGGMWQITGVPGTAPARLSSFSADWGTGGSSDIAELWVGIRPDYYGRSGFDPVWPVENGTAATDTSVSSGAMYTTFATDETMTKRFEVSVDDVISSDYNHMIGRYLVLARAKVAAADTVVGVQMAAGYISAGFRTPSAARYIDGKTGYHLLELGYIQIPSAGVYYGQPADAARRYCIELRAEHIEGTQGLYIDSFYLIPSEHFLYINGVSVVTNNPAWAVVKENDAVHIGGYWGAYQANAVGSAIDWYLPVGASVLVIAGQDDIAEAAPHSLTNNLDLSIDYYPRWRSFRDS